MDSMENMASQLDEEFDHHLVSMKPYVLRLPHKSERQRCALWIKKLCEPVSAGISGRKNRNMYSQLMLHMLKRGSLEGPFTQRPEEGPLSTLPAYMSIYFDDSSSRSPEPTDEDQNIPGWVNDLGASSLLKESLGEPAASSTVRPSTARQRFAALVGSPKQKRRSQTVQGTPGEKSSRSPRNGAYSPSKEDRVRFAKEEIRSRRKKVPVALSSEEEETTDDVYRYFEKSPLGATGDSDWSRPVLPSATALSSLHGSYRDEKSLVRVHEKELEMKTKMLEAKFHEEKLKMQQKHDSAVQKILDRKNEEIEDVKSHYRAKIKEHEEAISKLEKKISALVKESAVIRENKDKQIEELKKMTEESGQAKQNEFEKRLHDAAADFEQEKFEMQKRQTKNIQELLDDTNSRLQRMEHEYSQQTAATSSIIKELESRVQQLTLEAEATTKARSTLEKEKIDLEGRLEQALTDIQDYKSKYTILERDHERAMEEHDHQLRSLRNKTDASIEYMQQESSLSNAKSSDVIRELEQHISQLKQALNDSEQQRHRQVKELDDGYRQEKLKVETAAEKKFKSLQREKEHLEQESNKKIKKAEQIISEKAAEVEGLVSQNKQQQESAEKALEEFKQQVERNSGRMYADMKQQMEKVEADLNRSKQLREKQAAEFSKQLEKERGRHIQELAEVRLALEQEKAQILQAVHAEKEMQNSDREEEVAQVREQLQRALKEAEGRAKERQSRDSKSISQLESQVSSLREEVVQANQLRKQQLVELGLLREEEKQKLQREHETMVAKVRSSLEEQKLELQKQQAVEMERTLEKTNIRLKEIENEYTNRSQKTTEAMNALQADVEQLRKDKSSLQDELHSKLSQAGSRSSEEKRALKKQHSAALIAAQQELESQKASVKSTERKLQAQQQDYEDKITQLKVLHEEKLRGLMPVNIKQEYEDTILSLKAQVNALQQRASLLQEELNASNKMTVTSFGSSLGSPGKSPIIA